MEVGLLAVLHYADTRREMVAEVSRRKESESEIVDWLYAIHAEKIKTDFEFDYDPEEFVHQYGDVYVEDLKKIKRKSEIKKQTALNMIGDRCFTKQFFHMVAEEQKPEEEFELKVQWDDIIRDNMYQIGDNTCLLPEVVQIYSLKLVTNDEDYPLDVFGELQLLCSHNWNGDGSFWPQTIFSRPTRKDSQTLTKEDPYLLLTGPHSHPLGPFEGDICIAGNLILKGSSEFEDKYLTLYDKCVVNYDKFVKPGSCDEVNPCSGTTKKHYWLEMTRSIVIYTIVATIEVHLDHGIQLDCCLFTAYAYNDKLPLCEDMKVVLLDSRGDKVKVNKGALVLSRQTICVDKKTQSLMVKTKVHTEHGEIVKDLPFTPRYQGEESKSVPIGGCEMRVVVNWSTYSKKYGKEFAR